MEEIRNKVKESSLVQLDLADYKPSAQLVGIDLTEQLWQGLVLKEKDFRDWIKNHNWAQIRFDSEANSGLEFKSLALRHWALLSTQNWESLPALASAGQVG